MRKFLAPFTLLLWSMLLWCLLPHEKRCSKCGEMKPVTEFHRKYTSSDGYHSNCKMCRNKILDNYRRNNKEDILAYSRLYKSTHVELMTERRRMWARANPDKIRTYKLVGTYGITKEQFDTLLENQNHQCAICGDMLIIGKQCCVDHKHDTGKIRGILCGHCNLLIGNCRENTEILQAAIEYLNRHNQDLQ